MTVSNTTSDPAVRASQSTVSHVGHSVTKLLLLVLALWCVHQFMPDAQTLSGAWYRWSTGNAVIEISLFIGIGVLFVSIGLPRQTLALVGGYVYGTFTGGALALSVTLAGSAVTYLIAKRIGRPRLESRWPDKIKRLDGWTEDHVFNKTLALRLFPVGSNLATNVGAGIGKASPGRFFLASAIGFLPQTAAFALSGTAIGDPDINRLLLATLTLIASILIGSYVYKRLQL